MIGFSRSFFISLPSPWFASHNPSFLPTYHAHYTHAHEPPPSPFFTQVISLEGDGVTVSLRPVTTGVSGPFKSDFKSLIPVHAIAGETHLSANLIQRVMGSLFVSSNSDGGLEIDPREVYKDCGEKNG